MKVLFPNYLKDPTEYQMAEQLWQEQWATLLRSLPLGEPWRTPWLNNSFANGTPCRDGNPIFSAL